ncbi:MAG: magnesium/cobalt transporter CorA [Alphaproteobacteria bacterium]|nr:magnesium/cobalt transporter CorA [Alphaproteobacteria bacterium]
MKQFKKHKRKKHHRSPPGAAPGTITADPDAQQSSIEVIAYGPDALHQNKINTIEEMPARAGAHRVLWINVTGLRDAELIQSIGRKFNLHPLAMEDIVNTHQRPKLEAYPEYLFIVTRMPVNPPPDEGTGEATPNTDTPWATHTGQLETEQVAICLGKDFVLTFQERPGDVFDPVRKRLQAEGGRLRANGADYLAYALIDAAVDSFFPLMEVYGEKVEDLEQNVVQKPEFGHIAYIHDLKRDLLTARRAVWPQREMLNAVIRDESPFIGHETKLFFRDCYDHTIQLIDMIETYREIASGLIDIQLSSVSNKMNEVMKVLTIIATIFIPLTFISGIYGMNFEDMPELHLRYGYPAALAAMFVIAFALLIWFRRKGWLGDGQT